MSGRRAPNGEYYAYGSYAGYKSRKCPYCSLASYGNRYIPWCNITGTSMTGTNMAVTCMGRRIKGSIRYTQCARYKRVKAEQEQYKKAEELKRKQELQRQKKEDEIRKKQIAAQKKQASTKSKKTTKTTGRSTTRSTSPKQYINSSSQNINAHSESTVDDVFIRRQYDMIVTLVVIIGCILIANYSFHANAAYSKEIGIILSCIAAYKIIKLLVIFFNKNKSKISAFTKVVILIGKAVFKSIKAIVVFFKSLIKTKSETNKEIRVKDEIHENKNLENGYEKSDRFDDFDIDDDDLDSWDDLD